MVNRDPNPQPLTIYNKMGNETTTSMSYIQIKSMEVLIAECITSETLEKSLYRERERANILVSFISAFRYRAGDA